MFLTDLNDREREAYPFSVALNPDEFYQQARAAADALIASYGGRRGEASS